MEYLQEDISSKEDGRVPPDAFYMLQSIRLVSLLFLYYNLIIFFSTNLVDLSSYVCIEKDNNWENRNVFL